MDRKRRCSRMIIFLISVSILSLNACAVRRRADGTSGERESMPVFLAEYSSVNLGLVTDTFIGMTPEEANEYKLEGYEVDGVVLIPSTVMGELKYVSAEEPVTFVAFENWNEGAYSCYSKMLFMYLSGFLMENVMRRAYPEEELETCSKEEAIEACRPYVEACGYINSEVSVYAVKMEQIEAMLESSVLEGLSAPGPGYQIVTKKELVELENQLDELEEGSDTYRELEKKISELKNYRRDGACTRGLPWEKKHEVLILTYQPYIEGYPVNEQLDALYIIYSPLYGLVYLQGYTPYQVKEVLEEVEIISAEEAFGEAMIIRGCSNTEDVEVKGISLVYAPQYLKDGDASVKRMIPCWQVDFMMEEEWNRVLIDAQHGDQYVRVQEHS